MCASDIDIRLKFIASFQLWLIAFWLLPLGVAYRAIQKTLLLTGSERLWMNQLLAQGVPVTPAPSFVKCPSGIYLHIPHAVGVDSPRGQRLSLPREKGASYKGKKG